MIISIIIVWGKTKSEKEYIQIIKWYKYVVLLLSFILYEN